MLKPKPAPGRMTVPAPTKQVKAQVENSITGAHEVEVAEVAMITPMANLGLQRGFTIKREDDFIKIAVDLHYPFSLEDVDDGSALAKISEMVKDILDSEAEAAMAQYIALTGNEVQPDEPGPEGEEETAGQEPAADDELLTPEKVQAMKRSELEVAIQEYELEVDPSEYPKTKDGNQALRDFIIAQNFSDDDAPAEEEVAAADVTEEDIRTMKRPELIALIKANELEVDAAKYPKSSDLADEIIQAFQAANETAEQDAAEEPAADEATPGYTQAELEAYSTEDLKAVFASWELGPFPTGTPKIQKTNAIKKIMAAQE